jgi:hypothetical protein
VSSEPITTNILPPTTPTRREIERRNRDVIEGNRDVIEGLLAKRAGRRLEDAFRGFATRCQISLTKLDVEQVCKVYRDLDDRQELSPNARKVCDRAHAHLRREDPDFARFMEEATPRLFSSPSKETPQRRVQQRGECITYAHRRAGREKRPRAQVSRLRAAGSRSSNDPGDEGPSEPEPPPLAAAKSHRSEPHHIGEILPRALEGLEPPEGHLARLFAALRRGPNGFRDRLTARRIAKEVFDA